MFGFQEPFELSIHEKTYLLGEHADEKDMDFVNNLDETRAGTKNNDAAFIRTIGGICRYLDKKEMLPADDDDIFVYMTFGNPYERAMDKKDVSEIEARFLNDKKPHEIFYNGRPLNIYIKNIYVMPEGLSAAFSKQFSNEILYICDAGSQTINLTKMVKGIPQTPRSITINSGVESAKKTYKTSAALILAELIKKQATDVGWEKGIRIDICGGFSEEISNEFNTLNNNPYEMIVIKPEIPGKRAIKLVDPLYANATGMYNIAVKLFSPVLVKG